MKNEIKYIKATTSKIILNKIREEQTSNLLSGVVRIENTTSNFLIYKVMFNKNTLYSAAPACSFIPPNGEIEILVKRFEESTMNTSNDLFLIKAYPYEGIEKLNSVSKYIK